MINAAITGGETIAAGELIRILINHPDVNLRAVASDTAAGRVLTEVHRGLEGDTSLEFTPALDEETIRKTNMVFLCGEPWQAEQFIERLSDFESKCNDESLRIIDLTGRYRNSNNDGMTYGLPESNRKALVRGATKCAIPSAGAMAVELALFPLLKGAVLPQRIDATIETASTENFIRETQSIAISPDISTRFDPVAPAQYRTDTDAIRAEILDWIRSFHPEYSGEINLRIKRSQLPRGTEATISIYAPISPEQASRLTEEAYSDHAFSYLIKRQPEIAEVANTNKCLIHITDTTPADTYPYEFGAPAASSATQEIAPLRITTVIDNLLKGGAGNAVHCMNLLFGLSERTGLMLKASAF